MLDRGIGIGAATTGGRNKVNKKEGGKIDNPHNQSSIHIPPQKEVMWTRDDT